MTSFYAVVDKVLKVECMVLTLQKLSKSLAVKRNHERA